MPLFNRIAELMKINYQQFIYLTYDEIMNWFKKDIDIPTANILEKRTESYSLYLKNGKIFLYIDKNKYPSVEDARAGIDPRSKVLKGNVAYKGKIRGRVKLIINTEDISRIEKGDILVAKMTRPEMIVGLEKASAFVTDQGGMLSHAAIVSREMKKPCIVGTKFATEILKEGELVEVDANTGTIRRLA